MRHEAPLLDAVRERVEALRKPSERARDGQGLLPERLPRIAVEAGVTDFWWKYGCAAVVGIDRYGESAPGGRTGLPFPFTAAPRPIPLFVVVRIGASPAAGAGEGARIADGCDG